MKNLISTILLFLSAAFATAAQPSVTYNLSTRESSPSDLKLRADTAAIGSTTITNTLTTSNAVISATLSATTANAGSVSVTNAITASTATVTNTLTASNVVVSATLNAATATATSATVSNTLTVLRLLYTPVTVAASGTNYTVDCSTGTRFRITNPAANFGLIITNGLDGQEVTLGIRQDSTGSRLVSMLGTNWIYGSDITGVTLSTNAGYWDWLRMFCISNTYHVVGFVRGYTAP